MLSDVSNLISNGAEDIVEQYRNLASAAMADAQNWLREGALCRAIPEALPDAVMVTDEAGHIVSVNSQFELMFGYHRSEVIGCTPEMLLPEACRARHVQHRRAYAEHPKIVHDMADGSRFLARRKNGVEFRVSVSLGPVVIPAGPYTIVAIRRVRD